VQPQTPTVYARRERSAEIDDQDEQHGPDCRTSVDRRRPRPRANVDASRRPARSFSPPVVSLKTIV
jgi:hypothetical protein